MEDTRSLTITLYLDVDRFNRVVGIETTGTIQILLISDNGEVLWRERGSFTEAKGESSRSRLRRLGLIRS